MQNIHQAKFSRVSSSVLPTPSDADSAAHFSLFPMTFPPSLELLIGLERLNIPRQWSIISIYIQEWKIFRFSLTLVLHRGHLAVGSLARCGVPRLPGICSSAHQLHITACMHGITTVSTKCSLQMVQATSTIIDSGFMGGGRSCVSKVTCSESLSDS